MKILQVDKETFRVFGDSLDIKDKLPINTYEIDFSPMGGFSLVTRKNFKITEKLYGNVEERINKIIRGYQNYNRSIGVIFSGNKGIGKSLASQLLCQKMLDLGYPVILVNNTNNGIIDFLNSIDQECVFLFDEFEKIYCKDKDAVSDSKYLTQTDFLSFFDGTNNIKHLFIITCNEIYRLSSYLINRPGRFHYHIRWSYPSIEDITKYLQDKLDTAYWNEINKVCNFSYKMPLNYDCLRSISFELNLGVPFEEALENLNIIKYKAIVKAQICIETEDNHTFIGYEDDLDIFSSSRKEIYVESISIIDERQASGYVCFYPSKFIFNGDKIFLDLNSTTFELKEFKIKKATVRVINDSYSFLKEDLT